MFDDDGNDEIIYTPADRTSNYGARELYIYRLKGNELIATPLDCIKSNG